MDFIPSFIQYHSLTTQMKMLLRDSRHPGLTESRPVGRRNLLSITSIFFSPHKDMEGIPGWGISSMPGPPPRRNDTHHSRTQSFQQGEYERMIMTAKWYSGTWWDYSIQTFILQVRKKPHKNLTQGTCPDQGSNPGPQRDRRACYRSIHNGGQYGIHDKLFLPQLLF